jgi:hypothetical protein
MLTAYPVRRSIVVVLSLFTFVAALVIGWVMYVQRRQAHEQVPKRIKFEQSLVHYIREHHECSEEVAYQHIADFVKKHVTPNEQPSIVSLLAQSKQSLVELAVSLLQYFPQEIEEI